MPQFSALPVFFTPFRNELADKEVPDHLNIGRRLQTAEGYNQTMFTWYTELKVFAEDLNGLVYELGPLAEALMELKGRFTIIARNLQTLQGLDVALQDTVQLQSDFNRLIKTISELDNNGVFEDDVLTIDHRIKKLSQSLQSMIDTSKDIRG